MHRNKLIAALCLMKEGEKGKDLFAFAALDSERELASIASRLEKEGEEPEELLAKVQKLRHLSGGSSLEEVHPGWILEKLEGESPRVIGILCRTLPGDRVKYLIEHLSESTRRHLPKINESYQVSGEINQVIRGIVGKHLPPFPSMAVGSASGGSFSFPHIVLMRSDDLRTLFRDLGLDEIRKAFAHVEPRVLKAFLARFTPKTAKEIRNRIEIGSAVPPDVKQEAQRHLVSLSLDKLGAEGLFQEVGYAVFARAVSADDGSWAEAVYQKLPPEEGYRLKRALQETVRRRPAQGMDTRKSAILSRVFLLAEKGLIRKYWKAKS